MAYVPLVRLILQMKTAATVVLFTCVVAPMAFLTQQAKADLVSDHETFVVTIIGYDQAVRYSVEYGVTPSRSTPEVLSPIKRQAKGETDLSVWPLRELERRREERRQAAKNFKFRFTEAVKWVNPSPDGRYLLVGFEDPRLEVMSRAIALRASNFEPLKEWKFKFWSRGYIEDSEWSSDSRVLAVLETSERWSLAPRDLLFALAGHAALLETFFVNFVSVSSGEVVRQLIIKDVRYGTAIITRAGDRTKTRTQPK